MIFKAAAEESASPDKRAGTEGAFTTGNIGKSLHCRFNGLILRHAVKLDKLQRWTPTRQLEGVFL